MTRRLVRFLTGIFLVLTALSTQPARAGELDLHLVLAIDSSSSVTMDEYYLQVEGYARAFANPELWEAIRSLPRGRIAVALYEWSGPGQHVVNFDWRILDSAAAVKRFAEELTLAPRLLIGGETAIGDALLLDQAPGTATRQVIDVSGDGPSNRGTPLHAARDLVLASGATINGLAVVNVEPDLEAYFERQIIGGVGSFVLAARDYEDFRDVILRKLLREIRLLSELSPRR
jgi:Ca-activated chloride channel homolog